MTDDPTRAMHRGPDHGHAGPPDPHEDPGTRPTMRPDAARPDAAHPDVPPASEGPTVPTPTKKTRPEPAGRSRTGLLWTGLILSALVLVFLLIFILQNSEPVQISFLGATGTLPTGVALLFSAIAGLLLVAIPGGMRILQLRRAARRGPRAR
jgi:uncharacterized integral membrane protein